MDDFEELVSNNIGRLVAFVLTPLLIPIATAVAAWLQNVLGIDLDPDQLTAYIISVAVGLSAVIAVWLRNRGKWEVAMAELIKLHELGRDTIATAAQAPADPQGPHQPTGLAPR